MFLGLFSKKVDVRDARLFDGTTDFHSHLLPGVDDGVNAIEKTLEILHIYEQQGVKHVWCTPHIMEDIPNETAALRERFAQLQATYQGPIQLHLAAEYMMDALFVKRLAAKDLLPIGLKGNHLLVETSYYNAPFDFRNLLRKIQQAGFHPLLAHPERYMYMQMTDYEELHNMGVLFQLNVASLWGCYGEIAQKKAKSLLKKGMYFAHGSDIHSRRIFASEMKVDDALYQSVKKIQPEI